MKVFVNGSIHDSNYGPITLVFDNDEQRKLVAKHLANMPDVDDVRVYMTYPDGAKIDIEKYLNEVYEAAGGKTRSVSIHKKE